MEGPNPELYAELSKPHENAEAGGAALKAFFADVYELRKKHRIPDVLIAAAVIVDPGPAPVAVCYYAGDQALALPMSAMAYTATPCRT